MRSRAGAAIGDLGAGAQRRGEHALEVVRCPTRRRRAARRSSAPVARAKPWLIGTVPELCQRCTVVVGLGLLRAEVHHLHARIAERLTRSTVSSVQAFPTTITSSRSYDWRSTEAQPALAEQLRPVVRRAGRTETSGLAGSRPPRRSRARAAPRGGWEVEASARGSCPRSLLGLDEPPAQLVQRSLYLARWTCWSSSSSTWLSPWPRASPNRDAQAYGDASDAQLARDGRDRAQIAEQHRGSRSPWPPPCAGSA